LNSGIQASEVKIRLDKDQELKASEFRSTSVELVTKTCQSSGTQVSKFRNTRLELVKTKNNNSGTRILEFRGMRSRTTYSPGTRLFSPE
jgi:hypothetical protein